MSKRKEPNQELPEETKFENDNRAFPLILCFVQSTRAKERTDRQAMHNHFFVVPLPAPYPQNAQRGVFSVRFREGEI
jgi:hypothetical protein